MRRSVPVLLALLTAGCASLSASPSSNSAASGGAGLSVNDRSACLPATQGASDYHDVLDGIQQKTMTDGDITAKLHSVVGHMNDAAQVADPGRLRAVSSDAALRAGRMRVDLLSPGATPGLGGEARRLSRDMITVLRMCNNVD